MDEKHKVRIKLGAFEFEAEGDRSAVDEQLRQFLAIVEKSPTAAPKPAPPTPAAELDPAEEPGTEGDDGATRVIDDGERPPPEAINRAFKDTQGVISLRLLPKTKSFAADTLLLLIYGYALLKDQHEVLGGHLMKGGRQSGLQIDRVDRVLDPHGEFIQKGGARKGARYGLNNRGLAKAKEMLMKLYD